MDPVLELLEVYFLPTLAIARLGGSDTPLASFGWQTDQSIHGAHRTVIQPEVTLDVLADGSVQPYLPYAIRFRDKDLLRPVAPFFELWARLQCNVDRRTFDHPLTVELLESLEASLDSVEYAVTVANRKAQRRTGSAACAFEARAEVSAADNRRKPLLAFSPHNSGDEPLVFRKCPISLGFFQAIKPIRSTAMGVNLSTLRVRFTPARGEVYGPPEAIAGPASPLPPGEALDPKTLGGRLHTLVPAKNRILSSRTPWTSYVMNQPDQQDPQPSDSYDGANVGQSRSWGVVDDTCDGVIEAQVVVRGQRYSAMTRIFSSCPDFAPDRRPFFSFADDLADLMDHVGWRSAIIAGASMGGCIALAFAAAYPARAAGLGLIDTTAGYNAPDLWEERAHKAETEGLDALVEFQTTRWFSDAFRERRKDVVDASVNVLLANQPQAYAETCRMLGACNLTAALPRLAMPTRIVVGEEDYATPLAMAQTLNRGIAGSTLTVIGHARHLTPLECPDRIIAELRALLATAPAE